MSGDKKAPIIKKVIKKGHGGHHGSSWKVAYADFVTAMMAFFLVMWLLAISSEAGRDALADYFSELTMYEAVFNGGLPTAFTEGGSKQPSVLEGGCFSQSSQGDAKVDTDVESEAAAQQVAAILETTETMLENLESLPEGVEGGEGSGDEGRAETQGWETATAEQRQFAGDLEAQIQGSLGDAAAGQVLVEKVKGGLRINVIDSEGRPMFTKGGPGLTPEAKAILQIIGDRLNTIPNQVSIEGHTDASTYAGQKVTNWELSTARASSARLFLSYAGLPDERINMVVGYAATQPMADTDPYDPTNRRISLMIWDEEPEGSAAADLGLEGEAADQLGPRPDPTSVEDSQNAPSLPLPRQRPSSRPRPAVPESPTKQLTGEELERQLIERTMQDASKPVSSTLGP